MRFGAPVHLWLLLLLPAVAVLGLWRERARARLAGVIGDRRLVERMTASHSPTRERTVLVLRLLAIALAAVALARPQMGGETVKVERSGVDIVVCLDVSRSMLARDVRPDRLARARKEIDLFLRGLSGDRVGLVVFAGRSFVQSPLTTDYAAFSLFLNAVGPGDIPFQGTDIGGALLEARSMLQRSGTPAASAMVVLISDGEEHGQKLDQAVAGLKQEGIPVYAVGMGGAVGEPIPEGDEQGGFTGYKKDRSGQVVMSAQSRTVLRRIAEATGGEYLDVGETMPFERIAAVKQTLAATAHAAELHTVFQERFQWLLVPAVLLLLAVLLIGERRNAAA